MFVLHTGKKSVMSIIFWIYMLKYDKDSQILQAAEFHLKLLVIYN